MVALLGTVAATAFADQPKHGEFTTSDDVKIHYMTLGNKGSHVILIHGYTGSAEGNWFRNGIAEDLARNHRVVAIDCRNHGRSDKPEPGGPGIPQDVIELMDHLKITRAHIHGYSMGGSITGRLLAEHPERFLTASFGGSGIGETDEEMAARIPPEAEGTDPQEAEASRALRIRSAMDNGMTREEAEAAANAPRAPRQRPTAAAGAQRPSNAIDLTEVTVPVMAIIGEYDRPNARTFRLWRELNSFWMVRLPGKSHLTAISGGYIPKEYGENLAKFMAIHDPD
jgi:pimeloyl-ACP methyl ester carboxylesterase